MANYSRKNAPLGFEIVPSLQVTHYIDDATWNAVKDDLDGARGKTVALTGDATVGFGSSGDKFYGKIEKVEEDGCVNVKTGFFMEGVNIGGGSVSVGNVVSVDGAGGLTAAVDQDIYGPVVIRIDDASVTGFDNDTAVIKTA